MNSSAFSLSRPFVGNPFQVFRTPSFHFVAQQTTEPDRRRADNRADELSYSIGERDDLLDRLPFFFLCITPRRYWVWHVPSSPLSFDGGNDIAANRFAPSSPGRTGEAQVFSASIPALRPGRRAAVVPAIGRTTSSRSPVAAPTQCRTSNGRPSPPRRPRTGGSKGAALAIAGRSPTLPGQHRIDVPAATAGADKPIAPIRHRDARAVTLREFGRVGLDWMSASLAPNDDPDAGWAAPPSVIGGPGSAFTRGDVASPAARTGVTAAAAAPAPAAAGPCRGSPSGSGCAARRSATPLMMRSSSPSSAATLRR